MVDATMKKNEGEWSYRWRYKDGIRTSGGTRESWGHRRTTREDCEAIRADSMRSWSHEVEYGPVQHMSDTPYQFGPQPSSCSCSTGSCQALDHASSIWNARVRLKSGVESWRFPNLQPRAAVESAGSLPDAEVGPTQKASDPPYQFPAMKGRNYAAPASPPSVASTALPDVALLSRLFFEVTHSAEAEARAREAIGPRDADFFPELTRVYDRMWEVKKKEREFAELFAQAMVTRAEVRGR